MHNAQFAIAGNTSENSKWYTAKLTEYIVGRDESSRRIFMFLLLVQMK